MAVKKRSYKGKKQYPLYKAEMRYLKNRKMKLFAYLAKNPNDKVAAKAFVNNTNAVPRRSRAHSLGHVVNNAKAKTIHMIRKMIAAGPTPMPKSFSELMLEDAYR